MDLQAFRATTLGLGNAKLLLCKGMFENILLPDNPFPKGVHISEWNG